MRPQELVDLLSVTIPEGLPVLVKGPPGCGKTDIITQAAADTDSDILVMHPVVSDPTDFKGMPAVVDGEAHFLPFGDLNKLMKAKKRTVAFLDDLGQAPAVVQAAAMQLILARQINGHKISDKIVFIAATNRREDRAGVTGILEPVKSRFATIVELNVSVEDWSVWALNNGVPPEVVAFVRFRPEPFLTPEGATNDIVNRPSPRTTTNMSKLYNLGLKTIEVLGGAVGAGYATEFIGFLKVWQNLPSMDSIIMDPAKAKIPNEPAALYAVATGLSTRITADNAGRVVTYLGRLPEEFSVLGMRDCMRACKGTTVCKEFVKWSVDHQEALA